MLTADDLWIPSNFTKDTTNTFFVVFFHHEKERIETVTNAFVANSCVRS